MILLSDSAPAPRKWDAEIDNARQHDTWLAFETDIHQSPALRARVARALDRYGLGTSDVVVDEALDYLIHKELGAVRPLLQPDRQGPVQPAANHPCRSQLHGRSREQQRHITDCAIHDDDADHDDETPGTIRASHLPDTSHIAPDEYAARRDAVRAIAAMIPEQDRELYDLWLAIRDNGQRGEPGTLAHLHAYAARHGIGLSGVYARMDRLAHTIRQHPWFDEMTAPFRPLRRAA